MPDATEVTIRRDGYELIVRDNSGLSLPVSQRVGSYDSLSDFVRAVSSLRGVEVTYIYELEGSGR